jgi:undecaprenyl diphosphate synthase
MPKKEEKLTLPRGTKIPDHIALVLDGNRRWARAKGLTPQEGHLAGYRAMTKIVKSARDLGVHTFTVWAFSTENWNRPKEEIEKIFDILKKGLREFVKEAHKEKVRFIHLGRKDRFPKDLVDSIIKLEEETRKYDKHIYNMALDYGGRDEITRTVKKIVKDGIPLEKINEDLISSYLDTADQPYPYPDLFIRTSGEQRTSGLLPWQMIYSEYYFEAEHLPDFTPEKLKETVLDYSRRRRRFGGSDEEKHFSFKPEIAAKLEIKWWRLSKIPAGTKLTEYTINHLKEQYGVSKKLAKSAAKYFVEAIKEERGEKWEKATKKLKKFYELLKGEVKLAFEPKFAAYLEVKLWKDLKEGKEAGKVEEVAKEHLAEVYRISLLQAAKAAHLRVLAWFEKNLAEEGLGEEHWAKAEGYLTRYYQALKERIA